MTDNLESNVWICEPCLIEKHNFCHITGSFAICKYAVCYPKNMELTKKTLEKKYEQMTGVKPS